MVVSCEKMHMAFILVPDCLIWHASHLALVATRLGPDVSDLYQMRPSGTRMNAICI